MQKLFLNLLTGTIFAFGLCVPAQATIIIDKPDFSDISDLTLNGTTAQVGNVLRLTNTTGQGGSVFSTNQISLASDASFSTFFEFQMSNPFNGGADGIVFVVQTVGNNVGGGGGGIGYAGLGNSVGVEFDTFNNGAGDGFNDNHVGINLNGSLSSVARLNYGIPMDTGTPFFAWVDYNGGTDDLELRLSTANVRPLNALLSYNVNLVTVLGQTNAFVGFTSGTGIASNNHDILQWQLDNSFNPIGGGDAPEPGTLALLGLGVLSLAARRGRHWKPSRFFSR